MALKIKRFDASKHFETPEAQARLIDDALQSGNAAYIANALGVVARARGMSSIAKDTGLSRQALYGALSEGGNPSLDTIVKVMKALGIGLHAAAANDEPVAGGSKANALMPVPA